MRQLSEHSGVPFALPPEAVLRGLESLRDMVCVSCLSGDSQTSFSLVLRNPAVLAFHPDKIFPALFANFGAEETCALADTVLLSCIPKIQKFLEKAGMARHRADPAADILDGLAFALRCPCPDGSLPAQILDVVEARCAQAGGERQERLRRALLQSAFAACCPDLISKTLPNARFYSEATKSDFLARCAGSMLAAAGKAPAYPQSGPATAAAAVARAADACPGIIAALADLDDDPPFPKAPLWICGLLENRSWDSGQICRFLQALPPLAQDCAEKSFAEAARRKPGGPAAAFLVSPQYQAYCIGKSACCPTAPQAGHKPSL